MDVLPPDEMTTAVEALATRLRRANGPAMVVLNKLGGGIEAQFDRLPARARTEVNRVVEQALKAALGLAVAAEGRGLRPSRGQSLAAVMVSGAAGGALGLASSLAEMPATVTLILQAIRSEARAAGLDPDAPDVQAACLEVFAAASPLAADDGVNTAFLSARLTLTGAAIQKVISAVAPRLGLALGQKLAAQAVPILGAVAGATLNAAYLRYYRDVAAVRFGLMKLAESHGPEPVAEAFRAATALRIRG